PAIHAVAAADIRRGRAHRERRIVGEVVAVGAAAIGGERDRRRGNGGVEREGQARAGGIAGGVEVGDHHRVAALGRGRGVGGRRRPAIHAVAAADIRRGRAHRDRKSGVEGVTVGAAGRGGRREWSGG